MAEDGFDALGTMASLSSQARVGDVTAWLLRDEAVTYERAGDKRSLTEELTERSFRLAVRVVDFFESAPSSPAISTIRFQLLKSATSVGANYRAVCRAESDREFYSKLCIVVEEADETVYWLQLLAAANLTVDKAEVDRLLSEASGLSNVFAKSRATMRKRLQTRKTQ